jgi:hypothetical protein
MCGTKQVKSCGKNTLEILYIGTNNALYHNWQTKPNDGWSGENYFQILLTPIPTRVRPAAAELRADRPHRSPHRRVPRQETVLRDRKRE